MPTRKRKPTKDDLAKENKRLKKQIKELRFMVEEANSDGGSQVDDVPQQAPQELPANPYAPWPPPYPPQYPYPYPPHPPQYYGYPPYPQPSPPHQPPPPAPSGAPAPQPANQPGTFDPYATPVPPPAQQPAPARSKRYAGQGKETRKVKVQLVDDKGKKMFDKKGNPVMEEVIVNAPDYGDPISATNPDAAHAYRGDVRKKFKSCDVCGREVDHELHRS